MMTIGQKVGLKIRERRKELKMSADELGKRLGKDRSTIYRYENGDIENLSIEYIVPIAEALEMSPDELVGWEVKKKAKKDNDIRTNIIVRLRNDNEFLSVVEKLYNDNEFLSVVEKLYNDNEILSFVKDLDREKLNSILQMLHTFTK